MNLARRMERSRKRYSLTIEGEVFGLILLIEQFKTEDAERLAEGLPAVHSVKIAEYEQRLAELGY